MKNRITLFCILLVILSTSCRDKFQRYDVDGELDPYLQLFLQEGKKRGMNFDVEKNGLLMEFTDLEEPTIGLCTYQNPLLVQIDRPYWEETTQYEDQENLRQNVVFHELGHGLLNRRHDNSLLPNLEWKSIMCGGTPVEGRDWSVNFNGYRKEYYLNELFNIRTAVPEWSQPMTFDGNKGTLTSELDLTQSYHSTNGNLSIRIQNNVLTIVSADEENTPYPLTRREVITSDFYFETTMKYTSASDLGFIGPFALYDYDRNGIYQYKPRSRETPINDGINYLAIHPAEEGDMFFLLNSNCYLPIAEILLNGLYKRNDYNKFSIAKRDGEIFYYLNDQLVFRNDYQADVPYLELGILVPPAAKVEIISSALYAGNSGLRSGTPIRKFIPKEVDTECYKAVNRGMKTHNYRK